MKAILYFIITLCLANNAQAAALFSDKDFTEIAVIETSPSEETALIRSTDGLIEEAAAGDTLSITQGEVTEIGSNFIMIEIGNTRVRMVAEPKNANGN